MKSEVMEDKSLVAEETVEPSIETEEEDKQDITSTDETSKQGSADATDGKPELFQKQKDFAKRILSEKWFPNIGAETRLKVVPYSLTLSKASFILDG